MMDIWQAAYWLALGFVATAGCTPNAIIRADRRPCLIDSATLKQNQHANTLSSCAFSALEEVKVDATRRGGKSGSYILGFVEFDDQGKPWDPEQERRLFDRMKLESARQNQDLSIITFVHGWKHNAKESDTNVQAFQNLLEAVTAAELQPTDTQPRKVIGIYTGWRGETMPSPVDNVTFWTRKDAAQRVAEGSVRGLLGKIRGFHDTLNAGLPHDRHGTLMLTIGHSFGALVVYSALAQYFIDRAASSTINAAYFPGRHVAPPPLTADEDPRLIPAYGDLVVLINPAFEAMRYDPVRELADEQHSLGPSQVAYAPMQSPVLVEVTSIGKGLLDGDSATGVAFPIGRAVSTGLEATARDPLTHENERAEILQAIGHYPPFWTHNLDITAQQKLAWQTAGRQLTLDQVDECQNLKVFENQSRVDGYLQPDWRRTFRSGAVLTPVKESKYDPNNPFWVIKADPSVIADHDDISNAVLENFVTQMFMDIYLVKDPGCRRVIDAR
jgi:hypothetical protein